MGIKSKMIDMNKLDILKKKIKAEPYLLENVNRELKGLFEKLSIETNLHEQRAFITEIMQTPDSDDIVGYAVI